MFLPAVLAPVAAWADPVFLSGSGVGLEPQPGVTVTTDIPDFRDGRPFIWITELPPDALASLPRFGERLRQLGASNFEVGAAHGLISRGTLDIGGNRWRTWGAFLEVEKESVIVEVLIPKDDQRIPSEAVEAALRTITFRDADADRMAVLPFTVADFERFRPVTLGYLGASMLKDGMLELTEGPITPQLFAPQPIVMIVPSSRAAIPDAGRPDYARRALLSSHILGNIHIAAERMFDNHGVHWAEIRAVGEQSKPINILFFMRFGASLSGVITIVCTSLLSDPVDYSDRFRRLALSVRPKG